jgi:hypothetical protein
LSSERERGLYAALKNPKLYETVQRLLGADGRRRDFAQRFVRAKPGDRILNIGCGPADLLAHLPEVEYFDLAVVRRISLSAFSMMLQMSSRSSVSSAIAISPSAPSNERSIFFSAAMGANS